MASAADAPRSRRSDTHDPHGSRLAVLRVLYAADVRERDPLDVLQDLLDRRAGVGGDDTDDELGGAPLDGFASTLLHGLAASRATLDDRIGRSARGWRLARMPVVDRNVLRLAVHELLTEPTPVAVVLDEAVRLASELSTDDSGRYVNGVLATIVDELRAEGALEAERAAEVPPGPPEGRAG